MLPAGRLWNTSTGNSSRVASLKDVLPTASTVFCSVIHHSSRALQRHAGFHIYHGEN